jgi:hypothetical protein
MVIDYKISGIAKQMKHLENSINVESSKNHTLNSVCQRLISEDRICGIAQTKYGLLPVGSKEFSRIDVSNAYCYHKNDKKLFAFFDKFITEAHAEEFNENKFK